MTSEKCLEKKEDMRWRKTSFYNIRHYLDISHMTLIVLYQFFIFAT